VLLEAYRRIYEILPRRARRDAQVVLFFMVVNGVFELAGVTGILPLMVAATDPEASRKNSFLAWLHGQYEFDSHSEFLLVLALGMICLFAFINICGALNYWLACRFGEDVRHHVSQKILRRYLSKSYSWLLSANSSELVKNVLYEVDVVSREVVIRLVQIATYTISSVLIFGGLLYLEPVVAISTVIILTFVYKLIFEFFKSKLARIGEQRVVANTERYKVVSEAISAVREARAFSHRPYFLSAHERPSKNYRDVQVSHSLMAEMPRYVTETLAVTAILGVMVYLVLRGNPTVLPLLALYIMATWRLVPAVQSIYRSLTRIQFHLPALREIHEHLAAPQEDGWEIDDAPALAMQTELELVGVDFQYRSAERPTLTNISLKLARNRSLALVGRTGEGKSTLADVIAGLLIPNSGEIKVDGLVLDSQSTARWRRSVGTVPQEIFLLDDTVRRNIALGIPDSEIDDDKVANAARIAQIHEFISENLEHGYDSRLGERGVSLSGGQRQRIGIARSLYQAPEVLILDEATSSLDKMTERSVMDAIQGLLGNQTLILIAHRLSTVKMCDLVCVIEEGQIRALDTFENLEQTDELFRELVRLELGLES
jgi:ABC-type bacteriocin/lantibiotic exporter with double-glycine peptidase domain